MIRIEINTDNAAFEDSNGRSEIARILSDLAKHIDGGYIGISGEYGQRLRDINGNVVGSLEVV